MSCKQNLFVLQAAMTVPRDQAFNSISLTRWHQRLGHGGIKDVTALERQVQGMEVTNKEHGACDTCATQKAKRAAVSKEWGTRANARLEIVHMDVSPSRQWKSDDHYAVYEQQGRQSDTRTT